MTVYLAENVFKVRGQR